MLVLEKIFEICYRIWRPPWSYDPGHLNIFSLVRALCCIGNLITIGPIVSEEKSFEIVDGRTDDGAISSPGAFGSGEPEKKNNNGEGCVGV